MVSQLFSPSEPKNFGDIFIVSVLALHVLALFMLPKSARAPVFALIFLFWRACYNGGIGWLLWQQSNHNTLISWAKRAKLFENPASGKNPRPWLYDLLKREMETKIPNDYSFDQAPLEYNTWLTFRRVVDLILMCDFTSYCLFAFACSGRPAHEGLAVGLGRWSAGLILFFFNLWVKLDAHRVVKDFAWYWGDFFYLIDSDLTFDGVFDMAPHPMYSIGYAGYYGISLMAASYRVLLISVIAHAAQFVFLEWVENPHIEKTYNPPAPRERASQENLTSEQIDKNKGVNAKDLSEALQGGQQASIKNIIGLQNFDLHRVVDIASVIIQGQFFFLAVLTPSTVPYQVFFVTTAAFWRLWYSVGIGFILDQQSNGKKWTRHFIKYGESFEEAWRQWKGIYHLSMIMSYASFVAAAWKMYHLPEDWTYGMSTLRHVVGVALIVLQMWTSYSIYASLGEFGWFFGDFFYDQKQKLTYSGIYRYLNNPERILGVASVWGFALMTWSKAIFFLAMLSHVLTLCFLQFVERPHMEKRYGQNMRDVSGLSKTFQRSLPNPLRKWQGNVDRIVDETVDFMEDFIDQARPKLAAGVDNFFRDTTALFQKYPARLSITRRASEMQGLNPADYSITVSGKPAPPPASVAPDFRLKTYEYGTPLKVSWKAPTNHSKRDWIGLYMVGHNDSKEVTRYSSSARWVATCPNEYDDRGAQGILVSDVPAANGSGFLSGEVEFTGDKLWWTTGIFEFRYHHDGKHNVMAISPPFEVVVPAFDEDDVEIDMKNGGTIRPAVEAALLPILQNCFDRDPDIAPHTADEKFGGMIERDGKYSKRVVYAIKLMFGIEFAADVVKADGTVRNLAWRICNAKQVLAPYSMASSPGRETPDAKY